MKYLFIFLFIVTFISPSVDNKDTSNVIRSSIYNYITSADKTLNYLISNVDFLRNLAEIPYKKSYDNIMDKRTLVKHLVSPGESLDNIIMLYNSNVDDIEDFRMVAFKENPDTISRDYQISSGCYILVPSE